MTLFLIVLLVVAVGVIAYMFMRPKQPKDTQMGQNTGYQPLPAPQQPWGPPGLGFGYGYPGYTGSMPTTQQSDTAAAYAFGGTVFKTIGDVLKSKPWQ